MIPAIRDGNFALWESLAIVRYLCDHYGADNLSPADPQTRAIADQWMEWSASKAFAPVIYLFFATVRTQPADRDLAKIAVLRDEANEALMILDAHLADRPYVCGDRFTMGDIPLGCVAYRYFNVDVDRPALPNVEAWYQRLAERAPFRDHVMRHFGTNPDEWVALEKACVSEGVI
jgi:glutathione S-transferase